MKVTWKHGMLIVAMTVSSVALVNDANGGIFGRRRNSGSYNSGNYNGGAAARVAVPNTSVTAPGIGVTTGTTESGPTASVSAPGVGVNAGAARAGYNAPMRGGANVTAPGVNVGVGTGTGTAGSGANVRAGANVPLPAGPPNGSPR